MFAVTAMQTHGALSALPGMSAAPPKCVGTTGSWCSQVWHATHISWLASASDWLIAKPLRILFILAIAFVIRLLVGRLIDRAIRDRTPKQRKVPAVVSRIKEREHARSGTSAMSERRRQRAKTVCSLLKSISSFVVWGIAVILILGNLGINLGPIIASAGVVGIAVAFGAQNLVQDFLSGMFMMVEDQYGVGDWVDAGEASGTVEAVGLRVTTLRDTGGTVWYVRNGQISRVGNYNQSYGIAVVDIPLGFGVDTEKACALIERTTTDACGDSGLAATVLEAPTLWGVQEVGTTSVTVRVTVKTTPGAQFAVARTLRSKALAAVRAAGLEPPLAHLMRPGGGTSVPLIPGNNTR